MTDELAALQARVDVLEEMTQLHARILEVMSNNVLTALQATHNLTGGLSAASDSIVALSDMIFPQPDPGHSLTIVGGDDDSSTIVTSEDER